MLRTIHASSLRWLFAAFMILLLSACTIKLVGDYDEQIDKGITQLQKNVEAFLFKLEGTAKGPSDLVEDYKKHSQFYTDTKVAISGLRLRADAIERNSLTVKMLDKISVNLDRLERMDMEGLKKAEIEPIRGAFNSQFMAILTFELAKKRGKQLDESKSTAASTPKLSDKGEIK